MQLLSGQCLLFEWSVLTHPFIPLLDSLQVVTVDEASTHAQNTLFKVAACFKPEPQVDGYKRLLPMQGCGSVLATSNLDTIAFELSVRQRSSSSRDFVKPRRIARPAPGQKSTLPGQALAGLQEGQSSKDEAVPQGLPLKAQFENSSHALHQQDEMCPTDSPFMDSAAADHDMSEGQQQHQSIRQRVEQDVAMYEWLTNLKLRYFTPREVANLHSFPDSFSFPKHVTRRQCYALLGNSLSVAVVADLLAYLVAS